MNLIRTLYPSWRAALLGGGLGEGLPSPTSDLEILLSYDRTHTVVHGPAENVLQTRARRFLNLKDSPWAWLASASKGREDDVITSEALDILVNS